VAVGSYFDPPHVNLVLVSIEGVDMKTPKPNTTQIPTKGTKVNFLLQNSLAFLEYFLAFKNSPKSLETQDNPQKQSSNGLI